MFSQLIYFKTHLSAREKIFEGEDTNGNFFTEIFRNSVILAPLLSARENFLRKFSDNNLTHSYLLGGDRPPCPPGRSSHVNHNISIYIVNVFFYSEIHMTCITTIINQKTKFKV